MHLYRHYIYVASLDLCACSDIPLDIVTFTAPWAETRTHQKEGVLVAHLVPERLRASLVLAIHTVQVKLLLLKEQTTHAGSTLHHRKKNVQVEILLRVKFSVLN